MSQDQQQSQEVREAARQIAHRLIDEPQFREQVRENPTSTLTEAGMPEEAVGDFLRELGAEPQENEVSGYLGHCGWTCAWTCSALSLHQN